MSEEVTQPFHWPALRSGKSQESTPIWFLDTFQKWPQTFPMQRLMVPEAVSTSVHVFFSSSNIHYDQCPHPLPTLKIQHHPVSSPTLCLIHICISNTTSSPVGRRRLRCHWPAVSWPAAELEVCCCSPSPPAGHWGRCEPAALWPSS